MSDDLPKKLRTVVGREVGTVMQEAAKRIEADADRIAALEAERDAARMDSIDAAWGQKKADDRIAELEAEVARLRAATSSVSSQP